VKIDILRTQICLERWQHEALKSMSRKTGKSISRIVRECLRSSLTRPSSRKQDALYHIIGMCEGTADNVSENHDHYLYGATKKKK
jgi:hypothetical protein